MKVVQINATCGVGSTGKICTGISEIMTEKNVENYILYSSKSNGDPLGIRCSNDVYIKLQALKSRIYGNYGFNSKIVTKKIIDQLEKINPDIVHVHNIHGHDCHFGLLFQYLKKKNIKVVYTFHDCWTLTGYCPHFTMAKCENWMNECGNCVLRKKYSLFFDKSSTNFMQKRDSLQDLDLTIVTPSKWLAGLVKKSFLKNTSVEVIYNGLDLSFFHPVESEFRQKYNLQNKKIVLGVAMGWSDEKGIDVFIDLAKRLDSNYQIVLVGTNDNIDKILPNNILSIHCTQNQQELAEIYSAADVFANPTRNEVLGMVNIEALACGTPGVTFNSGGSPECYDETCGSVVDCDDIDAFEKEIIRICEENPYSKEACINKAKEFDKNQRFKEYVELYERIELART